MTDNEIIKALELVPHCNVYSGECKKCPYRWVDDCATKFPKDALDLINRQKAEKEKLEYTLMGVMHSVDKWLDGEELEQDEVNRAITMREKTLQIVEKQKAEIERLKKENAIVFSIPENTQFENLEHFETRQVSKEMLSAIVRRAKAEAITEFKKRAKEKAFLPLGTWFAERVITESDVDQIAKEMKGEQ